MYGTVFSIPNNRTLLTTMMMLMLLLLLMMMMMMMLTLLVFVWTTVFGVLFWWRWMQWRVEMPKVGRFKRILDRGRRQTKPSIGTI